MENPYFRTNAEVVDADTQSTAEIIDKEKSEKKKRKGADARKADMMTIDSYHGVFANIAEEFKDNVLVFDNQIYVKYDGIWTSNSNLVGKTIRTTYKGIQKADIKQVLETLKDILAPHIDRPEDDRYINFKNGRYDTETNRFRKYTNDDIIFYRLNANYSKDVPKSCKIVDDFISYLADGNEEEIRMLWEMIGYSISPGNAMQRAHLLLGEAGTGKSLLLNLLEIIIGSDATMAVKIDDLNNPTMLSSIYGKSLCVIDDADTSRRDDISGFKTVVSEGAISAKFLYQEPFTFHYKGKFIMSANNIPKMFDSGAAIARRLIIIPCTYKTIPEKERDTKLLKKLLEHTDYIIMRGLEAYKDIVKNNCFYRSEISQELIAESISYNNPWISYIENLSCRTLEGVSKDAIYKSYKEWNKENGTGELSRQRFWHEFGKHFSYANERTSNYRSKRKIILTNIQRIKGEDPTFGAEEITDELPF